MIQNASTYFLLDVIYVGIICIGCIALVMDLILRRISARLWCGRNGPSHDQRQTAPSARSSSTCRSASIPRKRLNVVEDVNYDINDGDFIAVIGPSGCGKTTMMSMLAGFQEADDRQGAV
ncbi:ATP-binding cassette domain-containing protein [Bradyrhizobium sp. TZ2]